MLRVRGKDGTFRIAIDFSKTVMNFKEELSKKIGVSKDKIELFRDMRKKEKMENNEKQLKDWNLRNGEMLFYGYAKTIISIQEKEEEKKREEKRKREEEKEKEELTVEELGIKESKNTEKDTKKQKKLEDIVKSNEASKVRIQTQKYSYVQQCRIDKYSLFSFIKFLRENFGQIQRCGYLIGSIKTGEKIVHSQQDAKLKEALEEIEKKIQSNNKKNVNDILEKEKIKEIEKKYDKFIETKEFDFKFLDIDGIYEPFQAADENGFIEMEDEFLSKTKKIISSLKKNIVGFIFSYGGKERKSKLQYEDLIRQAKFQDKFGPHFVSIAIHQPTESVECYQVSQQCVQFHKKGLFQKHSDPNKVKLSKKVWLGELVDEVDIGFLTTCVPIKQYVGDFVVDFPQKNREMPKYKQSMKVLKNLMRRKRNHKFLNVLKDYHLLFYLSSHLTNQQFIDIGNAIQKNRNSAISNIKFLIEALIDL